MIRYAGVSTLLPTPELEVWVNAHLPPGLAQYFCRYGGGGEVGVTPSFMPANNWPDGIPPRINTLYWPTGASRWASILLLVDADMMDTIEPLINIEFSAGLATAAGNQLVLTDSEFVGTITDNSWSESTGRTHVAMSTEMFALTPHKISDELWILPLVDERWFWQHHPISPGEAHDTWDELFDFLGTNVDSWTPADIATEYVSPLDLTQYRYQSLGRTIDACVRVVGHRFSRWVTKENRTHTFTTGATRWEANTVDPDAPTVFSIWKRLAGGEFTYKSAAVIPGMILVGDGESMTSVAADDAGATAWTDAWTGRIITPVQTLVGTAAWAEKVATDWVGWRNGKKADQTFIGVKAWHTTGYEDCVIIAMGNLRESPSTRIITLPENFGIEDWAGGTSAACTPSYEIRHWYFPSSGDSEIEVTYNAVTETITLPFNATPSQVKTAIDAHTEMVAASVECTASSIPGGNLWRSAVIVRMPIGGTIGLGATPDADLVADASTDYVPHITVVECGCQ